MNIIRVDFSSRVGFGHLKRVLRYVKSYRGGNWLVVCKECSQIEGLTLHKIENEEAFFELVRKLAPKEVIIDTYGFGFENEKRFKKLFPDIYLSVFDDLYAPHYADEVINVNFDAKRKHYKGLVPDFAKVTIAPPLVSKVDRVRHPKGVFVSLGATDSKRVGVGLLRRLCRKKDSISFFTTHANRDLKRLKRFCALCKRCRLYVDADVLSGMARAKMAVVTASTLAWEAWAIGVPFVALEVARNQKYVAKSLRKRRIGVYRPNKLQTLSRSQ